MPLARLVREGEFCVAEDLIAFPRDEDRLGAVAAAAHVAVEPLVEPPTSDSSSPGMSGAASRATSQGSCRARAVGPADDSIPDGGSTAGARCGQSSTLGESGPPPCSRARPPRRCCRRRPRRPALELCDAAFGRPALDHAALRRRCRDRAARERRVPPRWRGAAACASRSPHSRRRRHRRPPPRAARSCPPPAEFQSIRPATPLMSSRGIA